MEPGSGALLSAADCAGDVSDGRSAGASGEGLGAVAEVEAPAPWTAVSVAGPVWPHAATAATTARRNAEVVVRRRIRRDARVTVTG
jgi:hypothetical protein